MYIAIDFDGTIVTNEFPNIGKPVPGAQDWIWRFYDLGATLILLTMRSHGQEHPGVLNDALYYCNFLHGMNFKYVNENPEVTWSKSNKVYAHQYIDDHNAGCPLIYPENGNPYVDWSTVGPAVEKYIIPRRLNEHN